MSRGVNKCIFIGNCGQDPELKAIPSGGSVTNFSIGISSSWKDKATGQQQGRTEWIKLVFFNKLAEIAHQYVRKGSKIYVEAEARTRSYEKSGQTMYITEFVVSDMQMLDSRSSERAATQGNEPNRQPVQSQVAEINPFDEDLPF